MAGSLTRAPSIRAAVSAALPSTLCFSSWPAGVARGREVEVQLQRSGGGRGGREVSVAVHLAAVVMVMGAEEENSVDAVLTATACRRGVNLIQISPWPAVVARRGIGLELRSLPWLVSLCLV